MNGLDRYVETQSKTNYIPVHRKIKSISREEYSEHELNSENKSIKELREAVESYCQEYIDKTTFKRILLRNGVNPDYHLIAKYLNMADTDKEVIFNKLLFVILKLKKNNSSFDSYTLTQMSRNKTADKNETFSGKRIFNDNPNYFSNKQLFDWQLKEKRTNNNIYCKSTTPSLAKNYKQQNLKSDIFNLEPKNETNSISFKLTNFDFRSKRGCYYKLTDIFSLGDKDTLSTISHSNCHFDEKQLCYNSKNKVLKSSFASRSTDKTLNK